MNSTYAHSQVRASHRLIASDAAWPRSDSSVALLFDFLWIVFFVFGSGIMLPIDIGPPQRFVWLPADLLVIVFFIRHHDLFLAFARRNAPLLAWPILACVSSFWSYAPAVSLYQGLQLLATMMVGFFLCSYANLTRVLQIFFVANTIIAVLSLGVVFFIPQIGLYQGGEWQGLYTHKNMLGSAMAAQIVTGICLFLHGWRPVFTISGTLLALSMLVMSQSGSAALALVFAVTALPFLIAYRNFQGFLVVLIGLVLIVAASAFLLIEGTTIDPIELVLQALGKDQTLTGRTVLWDFGEQAYLENPWLGYGYKGYWEGDGTTVGLLRLIMKQHLASFHNNFLEVAVAFGVLGPIMMISGLIFVGFVAIRTFAEAPSFINAWSIIYLLLLIALCNSEVPLFNNHGIPELLLISIVGAGGIPGWSRGDLGGVLAR